MPMGAMSRELPLDAVAVRLDSCASLARTSLRLAGACCLLASLGLGCAGNQPAGPSLAEGVAPEGRQAAGSPAPEGAAENGKAAGASRSDALADLERKLRGEPRSNAPLPKAETTATSSSPAGQPEPPRPGERRLEIKAEREELLAAAEELARKLVEATQAGDLEAARMLLISEAEIEELVTQGMAAILTPLLLPKNDRILADLIRATRGKELKYEFNPGGIGATAGPGTFRSTRPVMEGATLEISTGGVPIILQLEQLLWVEGSWKIFRLGL
jgi:hypothetical protein